MGKRSAFAEEMKSRVGGLSNDTVPPTNVKRGKKVAEKDKVKKPKRVCVQVLVKSKQYEEYRSFLKNTEKSVKKVMQEIFSQIDDALVFKINQQVEKEGKSYLGLVIDFSEVYNKTIMVQLDETDEEMVEKAKLSIKKSKHSSKHFLGILFEDYMRTFKAGCRIEE